MTYLHENFLLFVGHLKIAEILQYSSKWLHVRILNPSLRSEDSEFSRIYLQFLASTKVYATLQLQPATFLQLFFDRKSGVVRGSQ